MKSTKFLLLVAFFVSVLAVAFAEKEKEEMQGSADKKSSPSAAETDALTEADSAGSDFDFEQLMKLIQALKDQDFDGALKMTEKDSKSPKTEESSAKAADAAEHKAEEKANEPLLTDRDEL